MTLLVHAHGHSNILGSSDVDASESWFWRLEARAKLLGIFAFVVVAALLSRADLVLSAFVVSVFLAAASRVSWRQLAASYAAALPFIVFASVSVFAFTGWEQGLTMLARTSTCVLALLVLATGTEAFDLFSGLRRLGVPALITTLLMLTSRFLLLFSDELARMKVARRARGFGGGRSIFDKYGLKVISFTAGMVLVRASARADRAYEGLKCKGFERDMAGLRVSHVDARSAAFVSGLAVLALVFAMAQYGVIL